MRVRITAELIETALRTGATHPALEVVDGLPDAARLVEAYYEGLRRELVLGFAVPGDANPLAEKAIAIRSGPQACTCRRLRAYTVHDVGCLNAGRP